MKLSYVVIIAIITNCGEYPLVLSTQKSIINGEDPALALILGQGFNSISSEPKGHCTALGNLITQSNQYVGTITEYRLFEVKNATQLRQELDVSASGSLKAAFFGSVNARIKFINAIESGHEDKNLLLHVRVANQIEITKSMQFTKSASNMLNKGHIAAFTNMCGNEFVYGRRTGGELFILFSYKFFNKDQKINFESALKNTTVGWSVSANISKKFANIDKSTQLSIRILRIGGKGPPPKIINPTSYNKYFNTITSDLSSHPVTLSLITKSYDGVEPFILSSLVPKLRDQQRVVQYLAEQNEQSYTSLFAINDIFHHPHLFITPDFNYLNNSKNSLISYLKTIAHHTTLCFENHRTGCSIPQQLMPYVYLPPKILLKEKDNKKCDQLRKTALFHGLVTDETLLQWQKMNKVPIFNNPNSPQLGLVGVGYCYQYHE